MLPSVYRTREQQVPICSLEFVMLLKSSAQLVREPLVYAGAANYVDEMDHPVLRASL